MQLVIIHVYNLYVDYRELVDDHGCFFSQQEIGSSDLLRLYGERIGDQKKSKPNISSCGSSMNEYHQNIFRTIHLLSQLNKDEIGCTVVRLFLVYGAKDSDPHPELIVESAFLTIANEIIRKGFDGDDGKDFKVKLYFLIANEYTGVPTHVYESEGNHNQSKVSRMRMFVPKCTGTKAASTFLKSFPTMEAIMYPTSHLKSYMFLKRVLHWRRVNSNKPKMVATFSSNISKQCLERPVVMFHRPISLEHLFEDIRISLGPIWPNVHNLLSICMFCCTRTNFL